MQRLTISGWAALAAAVLCLPGCRKEQPPEPSIQTVRAGVVEQLRPEIPQRYSASIIAFAQVDLAFKSAGVIERIYQVRGADGRMRNVEPGDKVARNTELAQVRSLDYQQHVDQAQAQLAQAEAQLAQARANFSESEIEYQRTKALFETASVVKPQYDQANGHYEAAQASVQAAEAAVSVARAALSQSQLSLRDTALTAPFAGWVTARNVDLGSLVNAATAGFSLIDTHLVKAVFAIPDSSLASVRLGQKQSVMLESAQHPVHGVVTAISPQADPKSRVFSVEVTLDNPREEVRPGMIGSLAVGSSPSGRPSLVVPLGAVVRAPADPNGFAVLRLQERDAKTYAAAQTIEIGRTFGNNIEVTRGLAAGDKIIVLGGSLVRDGQEVRVIP